MTQQTPDKNEAAEERTEDTRRFVRQVRAATRRKYTSEEKIRIVLEGFRREVTVNELCRREGIKPNNFYSWTKEFMESGKERLSRDTTRDVTRQEINALKRDNADLKQMVAELSLELHRLKKTAIPMLDEGRTSACVPTRRLKSWNVSRPHQAPGARSWRSWAFPRVRTIAGVPDSDTEVLRPNHPTSRPGTH